MPLTLKQLKGMTPDLEAQLKARGLKNSDQLLNGCRSLAQRTELAKALGVAPTALTELANRADLSRIKGVGGVFSDLLENAGVDTVKELSGRVPANLQAKLAEVAKARNTRAPSLTMVKNWIAQAKRRATFLSY